MVERDEGQGLGDDEALSWAGDEERGVAAPRRAAGESADADRETEAAAGPAATNGLVLVVYGVLAGASLISALGWVSAVGRVRAPLADLAGEIMSQFGAFLAIASPLLWFVAVLVLARDARPTRRILWHLLGLALTAPWPLLPGLVS